MDKKEVMICGDCLEQLKKLSDESVDAIVTDPPYDLVSIKERFGKENSAKAQFGKDGSFARLSKGFMGKTWDGTGIAFNVDLWKECFRVLKSGGHLLAFGGTRTYHRQTCAIEDAGFEIRDCIEWIYASGFPKSFNIANGIAKREGAKREGAGTKGNTFPVGHEYREFNLTENAEKWKGFGSALKPAHEPIVLARKPLSEKTIVEQVLKNGCGGLDVDGCRIPTIGDKISPKFRLYSKGQFGGTEGCGTKNMSLTPVEQKEGRFPANVIVQDDALNDGITSKSSSSMPLPKGPFSGLQNKSYDIEINTIRGHNDSGSKSRYFDIDLWSERNGILQIPKPSKSEKNKGCESLDLKQTGHGNLQNSKGMERFDTYNNNHPTVKSIALMSWLIKLVSKENDIVLDPFAGSGTTLVACKMLNRQFIGIEKETDYVKIIEARLKGVEPIKTKAGGQKTLF